ncbi:MAG TPA: hypothetical protein PKD80_17865 [Microthrixaceae bacterium]|jgi:hypothetical protein|nr:hypothetical protein [Microthrixaceae bacterium]HMT24672.1 hypothetical protein [Microthrixaceae bacterium]HMT60697.1 hypothetical protein [Microthrixaceae bacterium]
MATSHLHERTPVDPWSVGTTGRGPNRLLPALAATLLAAGGPAWRVAPQGANATQGALALVAQASLLIGAVTTSRPRVRAALATAAAVVAAAVAWPRIGRLPIVVVGIAAPLAAQALCGNAARVWHRERQSAPATMATPLIAAGGMVWYRSGRAVPSLALLLSAGLLVEWSDRHGSISSRASRHLTAAAERVGRFASGTILAICVGATLYLPLTPIWLFAGRRNPRGWMPTEWSIEDTRRDATSPFQAAPRAIRRRRHAIALVVVALAGTTLLGVTHERRQPDGPPTSVAGPSASSPVIFAREFTANYSDLPAYADSPWADRLQAEEAGRLDMQFQRGRFVNLRDGRRVTALPTPCICTRLRVWVLGGSSIWGIGSRDEHTVPSEIAAGGAARHLRLEVDNMGERGSTFDGQIDALINRLRTTRAPDIVIFVNGFNDVGAALAQAMLDQDREAATPAIKGAQQDLDAAAWLARLDEINKSANEFLAADFGPSVGRSVAESYAAAVEQVDQLALRYGFRSLFFLQPDALASQHQLEPYEAISHVPTATLLRSPIASALDTLDSAKGPPVHSLRHLFDDEPRQVFLGLVHHNEWASRRIADTIVDAIADLADTSAPR